MFVINGVKVVQNVQQLDRSARCTTLLAEDDMNFHGFSRLKLIAECDHEYIFTSPVFFVETTNGMYLSSISFIRILIDNCVNFKQYAHGPCLSDPDEDMDIALCFRLYS
jgi:hypothetical protein